MRKLLIFIIAFRLHGGSVSVYTGQYNAARTGANTSETTINQSNAALLYKTGRFTVTGNIWAQPLYAAGVPISGTPTNILVVATGMDNVYAFNADSPGSSPIWSVSLGTACFFPQNPSVLYDNNNGILGTPVINPATNVVYFVACTGGPASYISSLYALNLADGTNFHAPAVIAPTVGSNTFLASNQMQRPALLLLGSNVVIAYSSYNDQVYGSGTWYGWIVSCNQTTLAQTAVYVNSVEESGFWMSGGGPSSDGTSLWALTGNDAGDNTAGNNPESFLSFNQALATIDYMQPTNWAALDTADRDLGTGRAIVIGNYIYGGGKDGRFWVLNKGAMGGMQGSGPPIAQVWTPSTELYDGYVMANGNMYLTPGAFSGLQHILAFSCPNTCNTTPTATSAFGYRWSAIAYTSNGSTAGTGLLWGNTAQTSASGTPAAGTLNVFNADTLALVYSDPNLGTMAKFVEPTVVNGQVFMATDSGYVQAYALAKKPTLLIVQ